MKIILEAEITVGNAILNDFWIKVFLGRHSSKVPLCSILMVWSDVSIVPGQTRSKSRFFGILTRFYAFLGRITSYIFFKTTSFLKLDKGHRLMYKLCLWVLKNDFSLFYWVSDKKIYRKVKPTYTSITV